MKKSKKKTSNAERKPVKNAVKKSASKKASATKTKKKTSKKLAPVKSKRKTAKKVAPVKKIIKRIIAKKPIKKAVGKKPISKKPAPNPKREPRPRIASNYEKVELTTAIPETVKVKTDLPEDGPFMDGLGENLMNEAIQDTEDNMETKEDMEIQNDADRLLNGNDVNSMDGK